MYIFSFRSSSFVMSTKILYSNSELKDNSKEKKNKETILYLFVTEIFSSIIQLCYCLILLVLKILINKKIHDNNYFEYRNNQFSIYMSYIILANPNVGYTFSYIFF